MNFIISSRSALSNIPVTTNDNPSRAFNPPDSGAFLYWTFFIAFELDELTGLSVVFFFGVALGNNSSS